MGLGEGTRTFQRDSEWSQKGKRVGGKISPGKHFRQPRTGRGGGGPAGRRQSTWEAKQVHLLPLQAPEVTCGLQIDWRKREAILSPTATLQ